MKFWGIPNRRPGHSGNPSWMFYQLDKGIAIRRVQRRPLWTDIPGFNLFLSVEPERKEAA